MRFAFLIAAGLSFGTTIDRIAIIAGNHPILDSAINRDIRITSFLNGERPDFSVASRKRAASRLIDQEIIREQIRMGGYRVAPENEAAELVAELQKDRHQSAAQFQQALSQARITMDELKDELLWQMTVLRFIDARFRPAVVISDEEVKRYYDAHRSEWPGGIDEARRPITEKLAAERVDALLDDWLKQQREQMRIEYLEKSLQ